MKYVVDLKYRVKFDENTALPGITAFYSKEEIAEERFWRDWDYIWAESPVEAIEIFVKRITEQVEKDKLSEKYALRFVSISAEEVKR